MSEHIDRAAEVQARKAVSAYPVTLAFVNKCKGSLFRSIGDSGGFTIVQCLRCPSDDQFFEMLFPDFSQFDDLNQVRHSQLIQEIPISPAAALSIFKFGGYDLRDY
ncbi:hypothetical protein D3867_16790 (plasmid) [Azospirillum argentinense]|uniref:Uncharacterized protein n=1 Tax=Azospirillum brasilense TaxID=192 RepID=A0A4D8PYK0_AZOBR|nr:hypothetical protein D3867_16790 [Azospirillum argentinense]